MRVDVDTYATARAAARPRKVPNNALGTVPSARTTAGNSSGSQRSPQGHQFHTPPDESYSAPLLANAGNKE